jgi:exosortase/archaeosortase family protein
MEVSIGITRFVIEIIIQPLSLLFLAAGSFSSATKGTYGLRLLGWAGCALYTFIDSLTYVYLFHFEQMSGALVLFLISLFMLTCELSGRNRMEGRSHIYVGKVIATSGICNFLFSYITFLNGAVTFLVASQSTLLAIVLGSVVYVKGFETLGNSIWFKTRFSPDLASGTYPKVIVPVYPTYIAVVYDCTGLREIFLLFFAVVFAPASWEKKRKALLFGCIAIYVANVLRNNIVIGFCSAEIMSFELAHSVVGNIVIFIILTIAALILFFIIPEMPNEIFSMLHRYKIIRKEALHGKDFSKSISTGQSPVQKGLYKI